MFFPLNIFCQSFNFFTIWFHGCGQGVTNCIVEFPKPNCTFSTFALYPILVWFSFNSHNIGWSSHKARWWRRAGPWPRSCSPQLAMTLSACQISGCGCSGGVHHNLLWSHLKWTNWPLTMSSPNMRTSLSRLRPDIMEATGSWPASLQMPEVSTSVEAR